MMLHNASDDSPSEASTVSRQAFLTQALGQLGGLVQESLSSFNEMLPDWSNKAPTANRFRPPGALSESLFTSTCDTSCHACVDSCPKQAILRDTHGYPYLDVNDTPCVMCTDVPCTQVCPTGALTRLDAPEFIRLGTAAIDITVCTAYRGSGCRVCYDTCPILDQAIVITEGLPQIIDNRCTGCGVCVAGCPTPDAIAVYSLN